MPELKDRQKAAIHQLTERQLEALCMAVVGRSPRDRWNGRDGARANMGGASNRMLDVMADKGLLVRNSFAITWAGALGVKLNIARVPELQRDQVRDAVEVLLPELAEAEDAAAAEAERARAERHRRAQERAEQRTAALPVRFRELAEAEGVMLYDLAGDPPHPDPLETRLARLWDAIVNADNVL